MASLVLMPNKQSLLFLICLSRVEQICDHVKTDKCQTLPEHDSAQLLFNWMDLSHQLSSSGIGCLPTQSSGLSPSRAAAPSQSSAKIDLSTLHLDLRSKAQAIEFDFTFCLVIRHFLVRNLRVRSLY